MGYTGAGWSGECLGLYLELVLWWYRAPCCLQELVEMTYVLPELRRIALFCQ